MRLIAQLAQAAVLCAVSVAYAGAQDRQPTEINPIKWSLKPVLPAKPLKAGDKFTVQLIAEIEDGWHLYSTEEMPEGPKPTRIVLAPTQPFELSDIESPMPKRAVDPNFGIETEFYDHSATFALAMQVKGDATAGIHKLTVQVRYQSCTETLCLLPRLVKLESEVQITNREKTSPLWF
ncbi:MAG: protein-disulfide reductase DsbD N-terminal domain-containing protein [Acidobacteriota bacterium]